MVAPVGGSHCARCSGSVHISYTVSMSASKLRVMKNCSLPVVRLPRYSASRSQVPLPPAFLMKPRISSATSGVANVMLMSSCVRPSRSVNSAVTRNSGGRSLVAAMVVDHALQGHHFEVLRDVVVVGAVGAVHRVVPVAAGAQVAAVCGDREATRPPPLRDFLRDRPGIPHRLQRRVVDAREGDDIGLTSDGHDGLPCFFAFR